MPPGMRARGASLLGRTLVQSAFSVAILFLWDPFMPDDGDVSSVVVTMIGWLPIGRSTKGCCADQATLAELTREERYVKDV